MPGRAAERARGPLDPLAPGARSTAESQDRLARFDFSHAALGLYDFVYGELCDWYLELVKPRLRDADAGAARDAALSVLRETVALAHPVIPFVTEEMWAYCAGDEGLLAGRVRSRLPDTLGRPRPRRRSRG